MWEELAKTGGNKKYKTLAYNKYNSRCMACSFDDQHRGDFCAGNCILANIWPNGCAQMPSPYVKWAHAKTARTRKKYAQKIVDGCIEALAKLPKQKKRRKR
jgi:hypothetical protein